jgi:hypothetical protein
MKKMIWAAAAALLLSAVPATAQNANPWKAGNYWTVNGIEVKDGSNLTYANYLAGEWQKQQEFAKSKGWISSYHVLSNPQRRQGEPDIYLVTVTDRMVGTDEGDKRSAEMRAHMQMTQEQMQAASGKRAEYRTSLSSMMLRELVRR